MTFSHKIIRDRNFVLTRIVGEVTDENLLEYVQELNSETIGMDNLRELADCRGITSLNTLTVQGTILSSQSERERNHSVLAILVPKNNELLYGMVRAFQAFSQEKRREVEIFDELEQAVDWISESKNEKEFLLDYVNKLSV